MSRPWLARRRPRPRRLKRVPLWRRAHELVLIDVRERHRMYPETFEIPTTAERDGIDVGDLVKLIWVDSRTDREERMWVQVTAADGDELSGRLDNDPVDLAGLLRADQAVGFRRHHISQIWVG